MPKSPEKVTELVAQDLHLAKCRREQISRELEFAEKQVEALRKQLECDHDLPDQEMENSREDRCRRCGYVWVR